MYYNKSGDDMKTTFNIKSSNNKDNLYGAIWPIEGEIKGVIVLLHGLGDKIDNYEEFAHRMNNLGYIVTGIDQIGFGKTLADIRQLGYFDDRKNTWKYHIDDTKQLIDKVKTDYPNNNIYLLGISYGSFIARLFISYYHKEVKGIILIGSSYISPFNMKIAKFACGYLAVGKGWPDKNTYLYGKTIKKLNNRFEEKKIPSWLNSNIKYVLDNVDEYSSSRLTISGYYVLYDLIDKVNSKKYIQMIDKEEDILLLSGKDDPVTSFSKDVYKVQSLYKKCGINNVTYKIYNGMRHDLIHETNRDIVFNDIIKFLQK